MFTAENLRIPIRVAAVLFIICISLFLLSSNIRWVANDLHFYEEGFEKYDVSRETGFSNEELVEISQGLIRYFNTGAVDGTMGIFSDDEITHLRDVRGLIQLSYMIQWITLGYIAVFITVGYIYKRRQIFPLLNKLVLKGSIAGIAGMAIIGIAALIDFEWLFILFHRIFFTNDLWISSGYLPRIYTEGFFSDAGAIIAIAMILENLFIGIIAGFFILRRRRRLAD